MRGGHANSDAARWLRACKLKWETPPSAQRTLELHRTLDELLGGCQAAGDMPVVVFWRELWEMHQHDPEVRRAQQRRRATRLKHARAQFKIILNIRDTGA